MIRILSGILLVYGVAGGIENLPVEPSMSQVSALIAVTVVGFGLLFWGVKDIQK